MPADSFPGEVVLIDQEDFYGFRRLPYEDLQIYDEDRAVGLRADVAFDPRVIGLSTGLAADVTVKGQLWYSGARDLQVLGKEKVGDVTVNHVQAIMPDGRISDYWIEEPSFRVRKRVVTTASSRAENLSDFGDSSPSSPFPSYVHMSRTSASSDINREIWVEEFSFGVPVPRERFKIAAMDLPLNTAAVDYRQDKIVGYWNGDTLQEVPMSSTGKTSNSADAEAGLGSTLLITLNAVVVLVLSWVIYTRFRRTRTSGAST